ncbi:HNH endonuclease [compost metagenome]
MEKDYKEAIYPPENYCSLFIQCHECHTVKAAYHFIKRTNTGKLVLKKSCAECREKINQAKTDARQKVESSSVDSSYKKCTKCGQLKPITNFPIRRTSKQGIKSRGNTCRSCSVQGGGTGMNKAKKLKVLKRDKYICRYCGSYGDTVDHIVPMSKGGRNAMKNLVCACFKCNQERGNMEFTEFLKIRTNIES